MTPESKGRLGTIQILETDPRNRTLVLDDPRETITQNETVPTMIKG